MDHSLSLVHALGNVEFVIEKEVSRVEEMDAAADVVDKCARFGLVAGGKDAAGMVFEGSECSAQHPGDVLIGEAVDLAAQATRVVILPVVAEERPFSCIVASCGAV